MSACNVTLTAEHDAAWLVCDQHGTLRNVSGKGLAEAKAAADLHVMVAGNPARLAGIEEAGGVSAEPIIAADTCPHVDTEPVNDLSGRTVARICTRCHTQLDLGWACPDCDWVQLDVREFCDSGARVRHVLTAPCQVHA